MSRVQEFTEYRQRMNARIHETGTTTTKRFFALDERCYAPGAVDARTKELAGLSASVVLIVGGSIVIPHLRRAVEFLDELLDAD